VNLGEHNGDGIRYEVYLCAPKGGLAQMLRHPEGEWVGYRDYAALQAEVERLKEAWVDKKMQDDRDFLLEQVAALQAENARLRKAGDSVVLCLCAPTPEFHKQDCAKAWLAAKGVQP